MSMTRPDWTLAGFADLVRLMRKLQCDFIRERRAMTDEDRRLLLRGTAHVEFQVDRALMQIKEQLRAIDPPAGGPRP
jgi:hypothetical protein